MSNFERLNDKQKESAGGFASIIFIVSALFFFLSDGGFASLLSVKAVVFFIAGMFLAAIVIGIPSYLLQKASVKALKRMIKDPFSASAITKIRAMGALETIVTAIIIFLATGVVYDWLIAGEPV